MSLDEIDVMLKPVSELDLDSLDAQELEHLEEQLKLILQLVQLRTNP